MARDLSLDPCVAPRPPRLAVLLLVAVPILLNAIALFPELLNSTPSDNDQIFHYLFIERANQALAAGDNPFDHWLPELEAGFPQFLYYQNLPHLTVVALHHLVLERIGLLRLLNLLRYLLMVSFPLTVYWSMRRMGFSMIAAAVGAAFSSTLSSRLDYGFDYHSYIWIGNGMFPQLCAMHLMFIGAACLYDMLEQGKGFAAAAIASSAVVLSDLLYGYIFAVAALILWLLSMLKQLANSSGATDARAKALRLFTRFAIVTFLALLISAYQTIPFLHQVQYLNTRIGAGGLGHASIGVTGAWANLLGGHLYDNHRLPVLTLLVLLGIGYGVVARSDQAKIGLVMFATFMFLTFGRGLLGSFSVLLPLSHLVPFSRFLAGGDFGAILLAGLGGELIWNRWPWKFRGDRTIAPLVLLAALCAIALVERWTFYRPMQDAMEASARELDDDTDLAQVISALKAAPPGRVYAGSRGNWGTWMNVGSTCVYDLLPIEMFATLMPWQSLSLNTPYLWRLNIPSEKLCRLFNIRYLVIPRALKPPSFYRPLLFTSRYNLYQVESGGYIQLGQISKVLAMPSAVKFFNVNTGWIASDAPDHERYLAYRPSLEKSDLNQDIANPGSATEDDPSPGVVENETVTPDSFSAQVTATASALVIFKTTYHPNWHVFVDGREQPAFMVSPSFIGTQLTPGRHQVTAEYRSSKLKKFLMILSCLALVATIGIGVVQAWKI